jgi:hypothetical protein
MARAPDESLVPSSGIRTAAPNDGRIKTIALRQHADRIVDCRIVSAYRHQ